jgi:diguanylate cyclase (GGDEF)-like protein
VKTLLAPGVALLLLAAILHTGIFVPSAALANYAFFGGLISGLVLAWRFHSSRVFVALITLGLAQQAISYFVSGHAAAGTARAAVIAIGILLPIDFILISFEHERGFSLSNLASTATVLFLQAVAVMALCRPESLASVGVATHHARAAWTFPLAVQLCFAAAGLMLLIRYALFRKPAECGLFWALLSVFAALRFCAAERVSMSYFAAAAFILGGAVVETSYLLAYHDELTGLPSRRAFNDALLRVAVPYSIAMVDIDHFKRCNDTYGHDTGDQVLRIVAAKLARVSGGGQSYRYGGEEFAVLFPGKAMAEVIDDLEQLRAAIETSKLRLRGPERRQQARGPDRRTAPRGRAQKGHAIRELARRTVASEISVTVSIGVATPKTEKQAAAEVIEAADKALYRAKAGGRNRIETASDTRKRIRSRAAGIA